MTTYTRTTMIERQTGAHPSAGLPVVELHTVTTEHPYDEGVDDDEVRDYVDRIHAARVELAGLDVDHRERATAWLHDHDVTADDEDQWIERAIAATRID